MLEKTNSAKEKLESISQKINDFLQESGPEWAASGQQFIAGLFVLGFLLTFLFHRSLFFLTLVVEFVSLIWYILTIKYAGEKAKSVKILTTINLYLSVALIALTPYCFLARTFGASGGIVTVGVIFAATADIAVLVFMLSETGQKIKEWMSTVGDKAAREGAAAYKLGDVVLCDDKEKVEAGEKDCREILPYKDRFLHMLILGRPYIYFDPSVDNCPFFNPLIGDETDVIENAVTTFLMLNPDSPQYLKDLSEQLVRNTFEGLKTAGC